MQNTHPIGHYWSNVLGPIGYNPLELGSNETSSWTPEDTFSPEQGYSQPNLILEPAIRLVNRTAPPTVDHVSSKTSRKHGHRCMIDTCGKTFRRFSDLKRHRRSIHERTELFFCSEPLCPRSLRGFPRKDKRDSHEKSMHKSMPAIGTGTPILNAEPRLNLDFFHWPLELDLM
jgi:uncharacterized Zn-finger protein